MGSKGPVQVQLQEKGEGETDLTWCRCSVGHWRVPLPDKVQSDAAGTSGVGCDLFWYFFVSQVPLSQGSTEEAGLEGGHWMV